MPKEVQEELLRFLLDKENKTEDIFQCSDDNVDKNGNIIQTDDKQNWEEFRYELIDSLSQALKGHAETALCSDRFSTTGNILKKLGVSSQDKIHISDDTHLKTNEVSENVDSIPQNETPNENRYAFTI
jgi:hypothetical protein